MSLHEIFYFRMVRHYNCKTKKLYWSEEVIRYAIKTVVNEKRSVINVANEYNLPYTSLYDKNKKHRNYDTEKLTGNWF